MKQVLLLSIYGQVQGVFFRESMCREAASLGISGWVRNRRDGSVEATVQGEPAQLEAIIRWARRGPARARVVHLEVSEGNGDYSGFSRLPSA